MGFFDNFKEAMKRGQEAAENYRAREAAKTQPQVRSGARPAARAAAPSDPADPAAPFGFAIPDPGPIEVTDPATGKLVKFHLTVSGRAMLMNPASFTDVDKKALIHETVIETVKSRLNDPAFLPNACDTKSVIMLSHRLMPIAVEALANKGIKAGFRNFFVTRIPDDTQA